MEFRAHRTDPRWSECDLTLSNHCPHFIKEKHSPEVRGLSKAAPPINDRAGPRTQASWHHGSASRFQKARPGSSKSSVVPENFLLMAMS